MPRPVRVGPLDARLIPARHRDAGPQLIRHAHRRDAAKVLHRPDVARDAVGAALGAASPRRRCSWRRRARRRTVRRRSTSPVAGVDHRWPLARVVDERFLAGRVDLAHRQSAAAPASADSARRTPNTGTRRDAPPDTRDAAAPASRRAAAARCASRPDRAPAGPTVSASFGPYSVRSKASSLSALDRLPGQRHARWPGPPPTPPRPALIPRLRAVSR